MGRLEQKVALITGGARGTGRGRGRAVRVRGGNRLPDRRPRRRGRGHGRGRSAGTFLEHDVTSPEQWAGVVDRVVGDQGGVDVLVNNAGILHWATWSRPRLDDWNRVVAVNQTGVFLGMQAVAPPMIAAGRRLDHEHLVDRAACAAPATCFAYGATKWAVRGMTKSAAQELGPHGVRVNSIHPGIIDTPMMADQPLDTFAAAVPLGPLRERRRGGQARAVAGVRRQRLRQRRRVRARRRPDRVATANLRQQTGYSPLC